MKQHSDDPLVISSNDKDIKILNPGVLHGAGVLIIPAGMELMELKHAASPETVESELARVRGERSWLTNQMQILAAPMLYAGTGSVRSAEHNITSYVRHLENIADQARSQIGSKCFYHREASLDSCTFCRLHADLRKIDR